MKQNNITALFKREFVFMTRKSISKYIFITIFIMFINTILICRMKSLGGCISFDIFFELFKGTEYCKNIKDFNLPIVWLFINCMIVFYIGDYIQDDFNQNGIYVITRCGKRQFWISKLVVSVINVIMYYLIIFFISLLLSYIFSNVDIIKDLNIIVLYITTSIMFVIINNCLSLIMEFRYSFLVIVLLLLLSVFIECSFMPGQQSLILRHAPYEKIHGLTIGKSIIYNIVLSLIFTFIGVKFVDKKEIR